MLIHTSLAIFSLVHAFVSLHDDEREAPVESWPQFRGAQASGVADAHPLPISWNVAVDESEGVRSDGVRWRTPIPGLAHASPVVWGDRVFVATADALGIDSSLKIGLYGAGDSADDMVEHAYQLWCLDLHSGHPIWVRTAVRAVPRFARHTKATQLDSTPVFAQLVEEVTESVRKIR